MKSKAVQTIQDTHETLGEIIDRDKEMLLDSIRTLEKRIIADTKKLVSGENGKLVGPRVNMKQAHQIHADLVKNFKETYEDTAFRVTKGYNQSVDLVKNVYKDLDVSAKFTGIDRDMISELQKRSYNEYLAYGNAAQESISKAMYNSVLTKGSYEDLVGSVSAALTGHLSKSGKPMSAYADVHANDGLMNFHQTVLMKKGNDAGLTSYLYVGNVMGTTRPFCAERVMEVFTKEEIESWDFNWKGKSGPALTNRGGWNCRHHWQPVKKADVEEIENTIEKTVDEEVVRPPKVEEVVKPLKVEEFEGLDELEEFEGLDELEEPAPKHQFFDPYLEKVAFDWEAIDVDPDSIPEIQNKIIRSRFADAGNEVSEEEANDIRVSINEYTSELYSEYGAYARDSDEYKEYAEDWQVEVMKNLDRNLHNYVDNTLPFDPSVTLYRGKQELGSLGEIGVGDEVNLNYLSSFSSDEETAKEFAEGGENPVMMVVNPGNKISGASLAEFSESGYEMEVLLSDKNKLVCTSIEERDNINYVYFDSVEEVEEEVKLVEEEAEMKLGSVIVTEGEEEERVAKEEAETKLEEEKIAKEEVETKLEEVETKLEEVETKLEEVEEAKSRGKVIINKVAGELPLC